MPLFVRRSIVTLAFCCVLLAAAVATTVEAAVPSAPVLVSPAKGNMVGPLVTLSWKPATGATTYVVFLATTSDAGFGSGGWTAQQAATTYTPRNLKPNTKYYWMVRALNADGKTSSEIRSFTTRPADALAPELAAPKNRADVAIPVTLSWEPVKGAHSYTIWMSTSTNAGFRSGGWEARLSGTEYLATDLRPFTTYYWMVRAHTSRGTTTSEVRQFTTKGRGGISTKGIVSARGNMLLRDGEPWVARGVVFESFLNTRKNLESCAAPTHPDTKFCTRALAAQQYYLGEGEGPDAFTFLPEWNVDTIRLNLNQAALDHAGQYYDPEYIALVARAVNRARMKGYTVIVTPFAGRNKNNGEFLLSQNPNTPLDNAVTYRAGKKLAEMFGADRGVILETLNEPYAAGGKATWQHWLNGGEVGQWKFVGVNRVIEGMRDAGAKNVIIVQGMGATFKGFTGGVNDPLGQIAYSVHPFLGEGAPRDLDWAGDFGNLARTKPVIITAWGAHPEDGWCPAAGIDTPAQFLSYLETKKIGLVAYAFDIPFSIVKDFREAPGEAIKLPNTCATWGSVGSLIQKYFTHANTPVPVGLVASSPSPKMGNAERPLTTTLAWKGTGTRYAVYFGTDDTPDASEYRGTIASTTWDPGVLSASTTYYWRIDSWKSGAGTTTGYVWEFSTLKKGKLTYLFCDIKRALAQREAKWKLSETNYRQVIDALVDDVGCNGLRFHIDSLTPPANISKVAPPSDTDSYTKLYRDAYAYSRAKGLLIYANLLPEEDTMEYGNNAAKWSDTTIAYAKEFCPDFIGPFNENGNNKNHAAVVAAVANGLQSFACGKTMKIVAPDSGEYEAVLRLLSSGQGSAILSSSDIVSSHNNGEVTKEDGTDGRVATAANWQSLAKMAKGKPVWASENAVRKWSHVDPVSGKEYGIKSVIGSGVVDGLVLYMSPYLLGDQKVDGTFDLDPNGAVLIKELRPYIPNR